MKTWLVGLSLAVLASNADAQSSRQFEYDALGRLVKVSSGGSSSTCYAFDPAGNRTNVTNGCGGTPQPPSLVLDPAYGRDGHYPGMAASNWGPNWGSFAPLGDAGIGAVQWRWIETLGASTMRVQVLTGPTYADQRLTVRRSDTLAVIYDSAIAADTAWLTIPVTLPAGVSHVDVRLHDPSGAWGTWSAVAPLRFAGLPANVPVMPTTTPTTIQPAWGNGATWPDMPPWVDRWSSWAGSGDGGTGLVRWASLPVQVGRRVEFGVQTGPTTGAQRIVLKNAATGVAFVDINVTDTVHEWSVLTFDIPAGVTAIDVEAQDNGAGWGEWIALTSPRLL